MVLGLLPGTREITMPPQTKKQRIIDDLTAEIRTGILKPGDQLPSTRILVEKYDASIPTVRSAIAWLKASGLVEFMPGAGVFVAEPKTTL